MGDGFVEVLARTTRDEQILLEPFLYLAQNPGKALRTKLVDAFDLWMHVPPSKLSVICDVTEMLHTASLLYVSGGVRPTSPPCRNLARYLRCCARIDDVQDDSALRRGIPVAHKIYGTPSVINTANYVYFLALQRASELDDPAIVKVFTEELLHLHRGQGLEIHWRDSGTCPTEDQYEDMVRNKTGGLLRLAVRLMQICSGSTTDFVPLVNTIGVLYQIRDDYLNLTADKYKENKGFAEDLTEGKFSYPIMHCIRADTSNHQLANILRQRTTDVDVKKYAIRLMEGTKTFEATLARLEILEKEARDEITRLGGNPLLERVLDGLKAT